MSTATPKTSTTTSSTPTSTTTTPAATTPANTKGSTTQPTPISLDTNAAADYNPYNYPASRFGDPSLAIDGDPATAWTAQVNPAVAPSMAEGLVIDLKSAQKLASLLLISSTPGMKVQVYGAKGSKPPESITDPAWIPLSSSQVVSKRVQIQLRDSTKAFRFVTLWISQAPPGSTARSPGHVSVNEIELFPG